MRKTLLGATVALVALIGSATAQTYSWDLANEYGVSAERIRQIEAKALKKMKATLEEYA